MPSPTATVAAFLRSLFGRALAASGIAAAVGLAWWSRVDDARQSETIPRVEFGTAMDLGRSRLTPLALHVAEGQIVLLAQIENLTGETQSAPFGIPASPPALAIGERVLPAPDVTLSRDDAPLQQLQPRLPERIALSWAAPEDWQPGAVELRFEREIFKLRDNLYARASWLGTVPVATLVATPEVAE